MVYVLISDEFKQIFHNEEFSDKRVILFHSRDFSKANYEKAVKIQNKKDVSFRIR